ncbi:MAG: HD domain-containing protein [Thermoleophilaceae bacterium]|nr:HD domain-containing protein [Thermoleophilaceae bacterium]
MRRTEPEVAHVSSMDVAGNLSELAQRPSVTLALEAMREFLGMDVAYTSEIVGDKMTLRAVDGDAESFSVGEGVSLPSEQTYCQRVMTGRLPNINPDIRGDDRAASLPITQIADVGAFTSVPLHFSDGRLYGTLCAASHDAMPSLGYRELQFLHVFARIVADQLEREEIQGKAQQLESQASAAATLIAAVDARDSYTGEHSQAVVAHAGAVARDLGLSVSEAKNVELGALLHDIGKIAIPDAILNKDAPLTDEEWEVMRAHPIFSERLIGNVPQLAHLAPAIRAEHERWDGGGYPDGLAGEQIPLASRITLVCDAYHAMTSDRPYRKAMPADRAMAEIAGGAGTQFCPTAAAALLRVLATAP